MTSKIQRLLICTGSLTLAIIMLAGALTMAAVGDTKLRITTASDPSNRDSLNADLNTSGTKVVFHSDSDFLGQGILNEQTEIWLYDTNTMNLTRITTASDPSNRDSNRPSLSADGTKVAFHSDSDFLGQGILDEQFEIWLYDTSTMIFTRITTATDPGNRDSYDANLSVDGTKVVFSSDADFLGQGIPDGQSEIWLYDTSTTALTRITTASPGGRDSYSPKLSTDMTKIVFISDADFQGQGIPAGQTEVWLYDTSTMTLTRITTASGTGTRSSWAPEVNADGTKVAFYSDADFLSQGIPDNQSEIWLYDTSTMTLTRVTTASPGGRDSYSPSLNANGTKVAFESFSDFLGQGIPDNQREIWLYDTSTMTLTRVTTASSAGRDSYSADLSADGTKMALRSDSDFLGQGISSMQYEIWLFSNATSISSTTYLPIILKEH